MIRGSLADLIKALLPTPRHTSGSIKKHLTQEAMRDILESTDLQCVIAKRHGVSDGWISKLRRRNK